MLQKAIGHKTRLPKPSKSPSSTQDDIEIEIAELLYGLKTSRNQDSSQKLETNGAHGTSRDSKTSVSSQSTNHQTSVLPRSTSPTSYPSMDVGVLNIRISLSITLFYLEFVASFP